MTFGPPQQAALPAQLSLAYLGQPVPPPSVLRFGAIQLPTAIDGSVDTTAEVAAPGGQSQGPPMSAEAQRAYMKAKAEERARRLAEQRQQQQQQQQQNAVS